MSEVFEKILREAIRSRLVKLDVHGLRAYARHIGVFSPTKGKIKSVLIEEMLDVYMGKTPACEPSRRGAPVKANIDTEALDKELAQIVNAKKAEWSQPDEFGVTGEEKLQAEKDMLKLLSEFHSPSSSEVLVLHSPEYEEEERYNKTVYKGQIVTIDNAEYLVPLKLNEIEDKMYLSRAMMKSHGLQEGDVVCARAKGAGSAYQVTEIHSVNETKEPFSRTPFEKNSAKAPTEKLAFLRESGESCATAKYLDWVMPIGKGQRGLIVAPPKSGKTVFLRELAENAKLANPNLWVFTLLLEQSPETVSAYQKNFSTRELVYTSFSDEPEQQVLVARLMLKRAKRYAEMGRDVLFVLDSFTALVQAFNETEESSGGKTLQGGLESKTLQFVREYFSTGRNIEEGGSFTFIGTVSVSTGNPADELVFERLSALANLQISLSESLAKKRVYPALNFVESRNWDDGVTTTILRDAEKTVGQKSAEDCVQALWKFDNAKAFYSFLGLKI